MKLLDISNCDWLRVYEAKACLCTVLGIVTLRVTKQSRFCRQIWTITITAVATSDASLFALPYKYYEQTAPQGQTSNNQKQFKEENYWGGSLDTPEILP